MRRAMMAAVMLMVSAGIVAGMPSAVDSEQVVVAPAVQNCAFVPKLPDPFPHKEFLVNLAALFPNHPGVAETRFWESRELYELCSNPRVIGFPERDMGHALLVGYDCFIFYGGDVERLQSKRGDMELVRHRGMELNLPRDATVIVLGGEFRDTTQFPGMPRAAAGICDRCSAGEGTRTTCMLKDAPLKAACGVVRYDDIQATVISGETYQRSLASCSWYVEGTWSGTADVCYIKARGSGKINADCATRFGIDARDGDYTIFLGDGDGFVMADTKDTIYAGEGVNLLFIHDAGGRARVITPRDGMPCLRIIDMER